MITDIKADIAIGTCDSPIFKDIILKDLVIDLLYAGSFIIGAGKEHNSVQVNGAGKIGLRY